MDAVRVLRLSCRKLPPTWPHNISVGKVDGGEGRACRGDHPADNNEKFYNVIAAETLDVPYHTVSVGPGSLRCSE